jgi:hypothetical protein
MVPRALVPAVRLYDALEEAWESPRTQRRIGWLLVAAFLGTLLAIELGRRGLLPPRLAARVPTSHFGAVYAAFTLLLLVELVAIVFALGHSVADSIGKQFELLSLILLRKAFLELATFGEPVEWTRVAPAIPHVVADMVGALVVFTLVEIYYRVQRHRAIASGDDQARFVAGKKAIALILLAAGTQARSFEVFFTILIFSDVLIVLLSLTVSGDYRVVFRNSGFAAATVLIRLALTAPPFVNVGLGAGAAAFALLLSLAYDRLDARVHLLAGPKRSAGDG